MAGFTGIKDVVDAELNGNVRNYKFRKTSSGITTAGLWFDLATSSGNPASKQWFDAAPLTATQIKQSTDKGLYHGPNVSPQQKHLRKTTVWCQSSAPLPMQMVLCDYLLYYPTIDDSELTPQVMDNTLTLPRYTDGVGVQMVAVTTGARTGGQDFSVEYTNSDGVSGRVTTLVPQNTSSINGSITSSATAANRASGLFLPLQRGDSGVRSIESVTMAGADTGFFTIVLVKPLAETLILSTAAPVEMDYLMYKNEMPRIYDDAFLGFYGLAMGSMNTVVTEGQLKVVWN